MSQPLLGEAHEPEIVDENAELWSEIEELRGELKQLRAEYKRDLETIGRILQSGRIVFGGASESTAQPSAPLQPQPIEAWAEWKRRLPGACDRVIDALLVQPMTATQLIAFTKTSHATVQRALSVLKSNGLLEKDGTRLRLKRI